MLSTREAECVIAVAEYRNISKAAEHLHIAQPALSRSLRAIEDRLGVELFDRSTTPLSITYAGSRYLSYAKQYLSLLMRMEEEFSTIAPHKQSTLCFGVPTQIGNYIFPKSVSSFLREHPNIRIDMKGGSTRQLADLLKAGKLHLAVLSAPLHSEGMINEIVAYDNILLVVPRTSPAAATYQEGEAGENVGTISLSAVAEEEIFLTETFYQSSVRALFQAAGIHPNRLTFVPSLNVAWDLASSGAGVALIMQSMLRHDQGSGAPLYCIPDLPEAAMHFTLTYRASTYGANEALKLFIEHFRKVYVDRLV